MPVRFRTGHISIAILTSICLGLATSPGLAMPPDLTNLSFLPGDTTPAPAIGRQSDPEIVAGGNQYLAVWVDARTSMVDLPLFTGAVAYANHAGTKWDIYAARLDAQGNLIDQSPIQVTREILMQGMPDVAWNGENWLVVWAGEHGFECCTTSDIFAARVTPDGQVLDMPPITVDIDPTQNGLIWPTVASDGTGWAVVWRDLNQSAGIFTLDGARIGPDGSVLDPGGVRVRQDNTNSFPVDPDLVWAGDEYFLVWEESGGIATQRLTADLQRIGGHVYANPTYWVGFNPRVATDGTDFFVTWWSRPPGQSFELAGARFSHTGNRLDPSPLLLTAATDGTNYEPAVAFDGTNYVVAYDRRTTPNNDIFVTRVTAGGVVLDYDTSAIPVSTAPDLQGQVDIATAPGGVGTLIIWRDLRHRLPFSFVGLGDIFASTFAPDGTVGAEQSVAQGAPRQTLLRLVPNSGGYLAIYRSETSPETRILAQRVDGTGAPLDLEPVLVVAGDNAITSPAAAWNGSVYLVVWEDSFQNQTFGRRLDADLVSLDPSPIAIMPGNWPDVAAIGDEFLTVTSWEEPHEVRAIYSSRVRGSDGAVLDPSPVPVGFNYSVLPRIAVLGDRWLVTWQRHPSHDNPNSAALANFVDTGNTPGVVQSVDLDARSPSVIGGVDQALLVVDGRGNPTRNIYARRMTADGTFLDPLRGITVSAAVRDQFEPRVAWDGSRYVTVFSDFRNATTDASPPGDVYGARVSETGTVEDPAGFPIFDAEVPERYGAVAAQGGNFLTGGSVFRPEPGYGNYRIGVRSSVATTGIETQALAGRGLPLLRVANNLSRGPVQLALELERTERLTVDVYDVAGRMLRGIYDGPAAAGTLELSWDGRNEHGEQVVGGVYFVRARLAESQAIVRVIRF